MCSIGISITIFTAHDNEQNEWKAMETITVIGNNIYDVFFWTRPSEKYQDYFPTVQQIVDSFHVAGQ